MIMKRKRTAFIKRGFCKNTDGATAVEFALVSLPFFALIFAILETALVFFAGQVLESATADASRLLLTGQTKNMTQQTFKKQICDRSYAMFADCSNNLKVDVRVMNGFNTPSRPPSNAKGDIDTSGFGFSPGSGGDIVMVRAVYEWPVYISLMGFDLADLPNRKRLLMATSAFRNEPFGTTPTN